MIRPRLIVTPVVSHRAAPCVLHIDASGTTMDGGRAFHDLTFEYVATGDVAVPPFPITGCVVRQPGHFTVGMFVTDPRTGERQFASATVEVLPVDKAPRLVELEPGSTQLAMTLPSGGGVLRTAAGGPPAHVTGMLAPGDNWTLHNVVVDGSVNLRSGLKGAALVDCTVQGPREDLVVTTFGTSLSNDLLALVNTKLLGTQGRVAFLRQSRCLIIDCVLDGGSPAAKPNGYVLRTVHFPRSAILGTLVRGPAMGDNPIQLRAGQADVRPAEDTHHVVIGDCELRAMRPGTSFVRGCQGSTCTDDNVASSVDLRDVLFEGNRLVVEPGGSVGPSVLAWPQGGDHTYRANVVDLRDAVLPQVPGSLTMITHVADSKRPKATGGTYMHDRIAVTGNEVLGTRGRPVRWLSSTLGDGHIVEGNRQS